MNKIGEYFRFITPILVTIALFILNDISHTTKETNDKLFKHLTNDEVHSPKSIVVTRAEFAIYQEMRNKQMMDLADGIREIKEMIRDHSRTTEY